MKRLKHLIGISSCLLATACMQDKSDILSNEYLTPIHFSVQQTVTSRTTETGFVTGDIIGIYMNKWNGDTQQALKETGNYTDNKAYTYSGSGFISSPEVYYPSDGNKVDVYAYYPKVETSSAVEITVTVQADQSVGTNYAKSDFMVARKVNCTASSNSIPLAFDRLMSKIIINLDAATLPAGTPVVSIVGVKTTQGLNLMNWTYNVGSSVGTVKACPNGTRSYKVVVPPQTIKSGSNFIKVTVGGKDYNFKPTYDIELVLGVENSYTVTF